MGEIRVATTSEMVVFSRDELDLIVEFAGCSLDEKPGSNWVQDNGGLPDYICRIARAIKKTGKTTSQAIAIAVSRVKVWASGKGVDKGTQAKAAAALAEWEKLRAKSHAKSAVKASHARPAEILCLSDSVTSFNVDAVRQAWYQQTSAWRKKFDAQYPMGTNEVAPPSSYIKEMWTDYLIVQCDDESNSLMRVDYSVDADGVVTFETPVPVKTQYVAIESGDMVGRQMSNSELRQLMATVGPCHTGPANTVLLSIGSKPSALTAVLSHQTSTPLNKVLAASVKPDPVQAFLKQISE